MNLVPNRTYNFDFFYAERHVESSEIQITTNILSPGLLSLQAIGDSTITAGIPKNALVAVLDDASGLPLKHLPTSITWSLVNPQPGDSIVIGIGDTVRVVAQQAYRLIQVKAVYTANGIIENSKTATLWVLPGAAKYVSIEPLNGDTTKTTTTGAPGIQLNQPESS